MEKIKLGKTGMMVTRLGFGGIPIQRLNGSRRRESSAKDASTWASIISIPLTAIPPARSASARRLRGGGIMSLSPPRPSPARRTLSKRILTLSLKRLDTDYIDLYQFHGINDKATLDKILDPENGLYKVFEKAKKAGKIRHIGITSHQMDAAKLEIKSGKFETIMFPFNFITNEPAKELLPLCREQDMGFIVMKPLAGGMLDDATLCFKYLLQFPDVVAIPGIEKIHEIEEIAAIYEGPQKITPAERTRMKQMTEELGTRFCRRCDYCQPCAQGIPISMIMTFPTFVKRLPPDWYLKVPSFPTAMAKAASCTECGECESRCPFNLPIREMIKEGYNLYEQVKAANT